MRAPAGSALGTAMPRWQLTAPGPAASRQPPREGRADLRAARRFIESAALALLLAACASGPSRDGPPANPPADLLQRPDAQPRIEPLRVGGPNKPYEVFGQRYTPMTTDAPVVETGLASWYGRKFHGQPTASGEIFDMYAMTAAHRTMPIPSYALVRNPANGRQIVVRINDRGPFHSSRIIDLSYAAAAKLGVLRGVAPVQVQRLTFDDIRSGTWRQGEATTVAAPHAAPTPSAMPPGAAGAQASSNPAVAPVVAVAFTEAAPAVVDTAAPDAAATGYWLQFGAYRERDGAFEQRRALRSRFDWLAPLLAVFDEDELFRVLAGPYASRGQAQVAAERVRGSVQTLIVYRR